MVAGVDGVLVRAAIDAVIDELLLVLREGEDDLDYVNDDGDAEGVSEEAGVAFDHRE